jgi:hypothetical protein
MSSDERLERALSQGLESLAGRATPSYADDVLARSIRTRQRRARFPFQRSAYPRSAPHAHLASATGRIHSMHPALRFAVVASLAAVLGVAVVSHDQRSPTQPAVAPGDAAIPSASPSGDSSAGPSTGAAWVTGTIALAPSCRDPQTTVEKGVGTHYRGYRCEPQTWTTDDPRLTGSAAVSWDTDAYPALGGRAMVNDATTEIWNDAGAWSCSSLPYFTRGIDVFTVQVNPVSSACIGSGAYQGLAAIVGVDSSATPPSIEALIMPAGSMPTP